MFILHFCLSISEAGESYSMQETVLLAEGYSKLIGLYGSDYSQHLKLWYGYMWGLTCQPKKNGCKNYVLASILRHQSISTIIHIPIMLFVTTLLKWKFKSYYADLYSVEYGKMVLPMTEKEAETPFLSATKERAKIIEKKVDDVHVLMKLTVRIEMMKILARAVVILSPHLFIIIQFTVPRKLVVVQPMGDQLYGIPNMRSIKLPGATVV